VLKDGLLSLHVPYSYGFAIILLTVLVKAATFPLTKKQVKSLMVSRPPFNALINMVKSLMVEGTFFSLKISFDQVIVNDFILSMCFLVETSMLELWLQKCETHDFPWEINCTLSEPETINETRFFWLNSTFKLYPLSIIDIKLKSYTCKFQPAEIFYFKPTCGVPRSGVPKARPINLSLAHLPTKSASSKSARWGVRSSSCRASL
jgi:hypothetical protein